MVQSTIIVGAVSIVERNAARKRRRPEPRMSKGERAKGTKTLLRDLARPSLWQERIEHD